MSKQILKSLAVLTALVFCVVTMSCSKKDKKEEENKETFFKWELDGVVHTAKTIDISRGSDGEFYIDAWETPEKKADIALSSLRTGAHGINAFGDNGKATLYVYDGVQYAYNGIYGPDCDEKEFITSEVINITEFGPVNGYVAGNFTGDLYDEGNDCATNKGVLTKKVKISFRVKRTQ